MNKVYIYLVFSRTGTWLSRLVGLFNENKYVHSSISFDNSFTRMYSFGRTNPDNPISGGFVEENLYDGVYKRFAKSQCIIYRLEVTREQFNKLKDEIRVFLMRKDRLKYNFLGLFGVLVNMPLQRENYYFCTQFVAELLIKSGIYNTDKHPALMKADDLFPIENMEIVYKGFINESRNFNKLYGYNWMKKAL